MAKLRKQLHIVALGATMCVPLLGHAGAYLGSSLIPNGVTFPKGYTGSESVVTVEVCVVPGSPYEALMGQPIENGIAVWNGRKSSSANLRQSHLSANLIDFESVAVHELGHCIGLGHPNIGFGAGNGNEDFTQSTRGADGVHDFDSGPDSIAGTADDIRGDDRNTHYFHISTNNPFAEPATIDSTTYTNDVAQLPVGDLFATNASRSASNLPRYRTPFTEAVMQQGVFESEVQRTLSHDDISTLRYAMSGFDRNQGSADDYQVVLEYGGISSSSDCDISVSMDASMTGFAICNVVPDFVGEDIIIQSSNIYFNPNINWYYNNTPPCSETTVLPADVWVMFSVPCQIGVSTSALIADVIGDDLPAGRYDIDWVLFEYAYSPDASGGYTGSYRKLSYADSLRNGVGYWITNTTGSATIDVQGEYSSQIDTAVHVDTNNSNQFGWNLVGQPFRYPVVWADTTALVADGTVLLLSEADPAVPPGSGLGVNASSCTVPSGPLADCTLARVGFVYDSVAEIYSEVNLQTGLVPPFSAVWVYAGKANTGLRFTMPELERITP